MKETNNVIRFMNTFHGLNIISNSDCIPVRSHFTLEVNNSNKIVLRFYDKNGIYMCDFLTFNLLDICVFLKSRKEDKIVSHIIEAIGHKNAFISIEAIELIRAISL